VGSGSRARARLRLPARARSRAPTSIAVRRRRKRRRSRTRIRLHHLDVARPLTHRPRPLGALQRPRRQLLALSSGSVSTSSPGAL
jgi:hypothetical protein